MIPDYFEAITAYRAWNVHPNGLLVGQAFASPWKPYEPHVAICNHAESMGHVKDGQWQDAPLWECDCGIHAHQTLKKAESRIIMERQGLIGFSRCPDTAEGRVWGELKLWGKVIVHEDGYRAQYAYPGKLYCEDPRLARIVSTLYGVPVDVIVLEVPNDKVEWDYLLPPMQWLNPQFNPSALSGVYKFWRNTPPAPTPVAPAVAKFVQQASLAQIKAIGATPWQQAQTQLQAKQFPMLTTDWQEMWKNGFKLKKKDEALLLPNTPPPGQVSYPGYQPSLKQIQFFAAGQGGKTKLQRSMWQTYLAATQWASTPNSPMALGSPVAGCSCPACTYCRAQLLVQTSGRMTRKP